LTITLLAYVYAQAIEAGMPLASIGLLSFSAAAQFAPAILIGLYWKGASRTGAIFGLSIGVASWFFFLLLPSFSTAAGELPSISFNQGAAWSLFLNALITVLVSLVVPDGKPAPGAARGGDHESGLITLGELQKTIGRFLGLENTTEALATHLGTTTLEPAALATPATVQFGERLLAGSIGSASARTVLTTALHHRGLRARDVMELLDRTSQAVQFNRELLESTLDNMSQGVAVVDRDLRLVGWNRRYLQLMQFDESLVHLGQPVEELIRINAARGLLGDGDAEGDIDLAVNKRLEHLRSGLPYRFERPWLDGTVMEMQGNPLPGGGYVTTYTDITHFKEIERKLQEVNETLEQRVLQRTQELSDAVQELELAREVAESANLSKTRFLAAASHDLLQPMNAARLFISILRQQQEPDGEQAQLVKRVDRSLSAAEELLSALLDISKLDSGMYRPELEALSVEDMFEQLRRRFQPLAANRNLQLRVHAIDCFVCSDRKLLYRILQNFLANAIRYTEKGGVVLGCQRRGGQLRLSVWDTGVGIDAADSEAIFQEFHRLEYAQRLDEKGLGLGLAICDRIARMLQHEILVRSRPGHGSCFSITTPLAPADAVKSRAKPVDSTRDYAPLEGRVVLCIDNEPDILDGMKLLLERWGCVARLAANREQAVQQVTQFGAPDFVLADYQLAEPHDGLEVVAHLDKLVGAPLPTIVITADRSTELEDKARARGYGLLRKPIKPATLRTLITNMLKNP
jgi:signal transduction histidine kinase